MHHARPSLSSSARVSCPSWDRTRTLLLQRRIRRLANARTSASGADKGRHRTTPICPRVPEFLPDISAHANAGALVPIRWVSMGTEPSPTVPTRRHALFGLFASHGEFYHPDRGDWETRGMTSTSSEMRNLPAKTNANGRAKVTGRGRGKGGGRPELTIDSKVVTGMASWVLPRSKSPSSSDAPLMRSSSMLHHYLSRLRFRIEFSRFGNMIDQQRPRQKLSHPVISWE